MMMNIYSSFRLFRPQFLVGTTKLFIAIAITAAHKFQVEMKSIHLDGS